MWNVSHTKMPCNLRRWYFFAHTPHFTISIKCILLYIVILLIASVCSFCIERCYLKLQSSGLPKLKNRRMKLREGEMESPERLYLLVTNAKWQGELHQFTFLFFSVFWFTLGNSVDIVIISNSVGVSHVCNFGLQLSANSLVSYVTAFDSQLLHIYLELAVPTDSSTWSVLVLKIHVNAADTLYARFEY